MKGGGRVWTCNVVGKRGVVGLELDCGREGVELYGGWRTFQLTSAPSYQAGLSVMNLQKGTLPHGWLEYSDEVSGRPYYYNVHNKATPFRDPHTHTHTH